jgi:hypothetical protein
MFSLAEKMRVINADSDFKFYNSANTEITAAAGIAGNTVRLAVNGFNTFDISTVSNIKLRRSVPATVQVSDYTVVAPAGIAIGESIQVAVYGKTTRYQTELKNNFIGAARPIVFSTLPLTAITPAAIATAIKTGWTTYLNLFHMAETPIASVVDAGGGVFTITNAVKYESFTIKRVTIERVAQGIANQFPVTLAQNVTTAGTEGSGTGKFIEEGIRMATWENTNPYGVDNIDSSVDIRGAYTEVTVETAYTRDEDLSTLAADHGPLNSRRKFVMFINENTISGGTAIEKLAELAIGLAGSLATVSVSVVAAPLALATEELEALIIADTSSVATSAAFIA